MTEPQRCSHGLTLRETCEACDREWATEILRRWQQPVHEAERVIEGGESRDERTDQTV
jgi:hypothetical protein